MNQTHFKWYEFDVNVVRIFLATYTYKSTRNEYESEIIMSIQKGEWIHISDTYTHSYLLYYYIILTLLIFKV